MTPEPLFDAESARALLAEYDEREMRHGDVPLILAALQGLADDEVVAWNQQHRVALWRAMLDQPRASKSSIYQQRKALVTWEVLHDAGRVDDDYRDVESGRKVRTLIYELARLKFTDDALIASYDNMREWPIDEVKQEMSWAARRSSYNKNEAPT